MEPITCKMIDEARATGRGSRLWLEIIKTVLVIFVIEVLYTFITTLAIMLSGFKDDDMAWTIGQLWGQLIAIMLTVAYCRFIEKRPVSSVGFVKRNFWKEYLKGIGIGFGLFACVVVVGAAIGAFRFKGLSENMDPVILLLFLGGFVIQGMNEEVMCRGYMMVSIARKSSVAAAIAVNSIFFAVLHGTNNGFGVVPCVNLVLFAVFASVYTLKTENLWGVGAIHSVWNFVQGNFFGLSVSGMEAMPTVFVFASTDMTLANGGAFGPEGGLIVTVVLSAGLIVMLLPFFKKKTVKAE